MPGQATLANTPTASTTQAMANACITPVRRPTATQNATEGMADRPKTSQNTGSMRTASGEPRTMTTMKVAVIT